MSIKNRFFTAFKVTTDTIEFFGSFGSFGSFQYFHILEIEKDPKLVFAKNIKKFMLTNFLLKNKI
jgi:hypothetical protein